MKRQGKDKPFTGYFPTGMKPQTTTKQIKGILCISLLYHTLSWQLIHRSCACPVKAYSVCTDGLLLVSGDFRVGSCSITSKGSYTLSANRSSFLWETPDPKHNSPCLRNTAWRMSYCLQNKHSNAALLISSKLLSPYSWEGVPRSSSSHFSGTSQNSALFYMCSACLACGPAWPELQPTGTGILAETRPREHRHRATKTYIQATGAK